MRLTPVERAQLLAAARATLGSSWSMWLFGSRADDSRSGGDIDLLVVLPDEGALLAALPWKARFLVAAKTLIGDQRIDLVLTTGDRMRDDPFLQDILPRAIRLGTADGEVA